MSSIQNTGTSKNKNSNLALTIILIIITIIWFIQIGNNLDFSNDFEYKLSFTLPVAITIGNVVIIILEIILFLQSTFSYLKSGNNQGKIIRLNGIKTSQLCGILGFMTLILYLTGQLIHSYSKDFGVIIIDVVALFIPMLWLILGSYYSYREEFAPQFAYKGRHTRSRIFTRKITSRNTMPSVYLIAMPILIALISILLIFVTLFIGEKVEFINYSLSLTGTFFYLFGGIPLIIGGVIFKRHYLKDESLTEKKERNKINRVLFEIFFIGLICCPLMLMLGISLSIFICTNYIQQNYIYLWMGIINFPIFFFLIFILGIIQIPSADQTSLTKIIVILIDLFLIFLISFLAIPNGLTLAFLFNPEISIEHPQRNGIAFIVLNIMLFASIIVFYLGTKIRRHL